jgi:cytochrome P450
VSLNSGPSDLVPLVDFDHHSDRFAEHLTEIAYELRGCPVAYTQNNGGHYVVSSHALVKQVLSDPEHFSSARDADGVGGEFIPPFSLPLPDGLGLLPAECDAPQHTQMRRSLGPWFNRTAVERLRPRIEQVVRSVFDDLVQRREFDVVTDIGHVVGPTLIIEYLGLPADRREFFINAARSGADSSGELTGLKEMIAVLAEVVRQRRQAPTDDLGSFLVNSTDLGLSDAEAVSTLLTLTLGGVDTTEALITNSIWTLSADNRLRTHLIEDPALIPRALDELLRFHSVSPTVARTVTSDIELGGVLFRAGDRVLVFVTAANHHGDVFEGPEVLDIERNCAPSLSFGFGPHRCIGARLGKVEVEVILTQLLTRIPRFAVDVERSVPSADRSHSNGWLAMPVMTNLRD